MSRRILVLLCAGTLLVTAAPALARSSVIAHRTVKTTGAVFLSSRLISSHKYRVDILTQGHRVFGGYGVEDYIYVTNHQIAEGSKSLTFKGKSPRSFTIQQPISNHLGSWVLTVTIESPGARNLTVRFVDITPPATVKKKK